MAKEGRQLGGFSSGLAVVLNGKQKKEGSGKSHLVSYCDDFGDQSVERTLEHIFDLPCKTINPLTHTVDTSAVRSIIKNEFYKYHQKSKLDGDGNSDGVSRVCGALELHVVGLEQSSMCGDIRFVKPPLLVESHAPFSSVRADACVWKGKWMYEVTLETCGVQQLGWATVACPFSDHKGVGDADDSYAYDGKRVSKWSKEAEPYGQFWVVGDVIGCCIDLDSDEIIFYRNGNSLGVAFSGIRKMVPGLGYYPAFSLSQGERCELNFGARPFRYPVEGFLPIQAPPPFCSVAADLLGCFSRMLEMQRMERAEGDTFEKLRRLKRFASFDKLSVPVSRAICEELFSALGSEIGSAEYVAWGPFLLFILDVLRMHPPHDYKSMDMVLDSFLEFEESNILFEHTIDALSSRCKTTSLVLTECPYTGSYNYLTLACHMLRREELMTLWWKSSYFEFLYEGFLFRKNPNKQDLQCLIPSVWWPGCSEDMSNENSMQLTTTALSEAINKIEEKQRDLCRLVMQFIPPVTPLQLPGSVFRTFLQNILLKNRGADRNMPPPGVSNNSVLVSLYTVILHFLSEGFAAGDIYGWIKGCGTNSTADIGFLHRGGEQSFPAGLFLRNDPHRVDISRLGGTYSHLAKCYPVNDQQEEEVIRWEEGCMGDEEDRVTHLGRQRPCCCSSYDVEFSKMSKDPIRYLVKGSRGSCSSIPERSSHVTAECTTGNLNDEITDKPSTSDHSDTEFRFRPTQRTRMLPKENTLSSASLKEEELLDAMILLYHLGLAPNFKQVSSSMSRQSQSISLLEDTDRQIRDRAYGEKVKRLKEARSMYREEVMDCIRSCAWYRLTLFSRWKQRGMYAACMWISQFLLVLSKVDSVFIYIPEYYLETVVDCFHVLRKSDPAFVPASLFIKQGLASFVTLVVIHFNDSRISSAELKDLLLQSISVLVQYKEFLCAFECNQAAIQRLPKALLSAFDNRSWVPVTSIILRLCKGSCFSSSKQGESSSSSAIFQNLLREACVSDEELFSAFLNRLFNTLSWAMTEFSVSVRELQETYKAMDFQQRKCSLVFDLSCNLARLLDFCTREIPQAFLSGTDTNLQRLTELVVFILNNLLSTADSDFFDLSLRRPGQSTEKVNRGMILAPLAGIIVNLLGPGGKADCMEHKDIVARFASMDCADTVHSGLQFLLDYCSVTSKSCLRMCQSGLSGEDDYFGKLAELEKFSSQLLICKNELQEFEKTFDGGEPDFNDDTCCICYSSQANARFVPCSHVSCYRCISRHLLNCERCFFCNATVVEVVRDDSEAV